ncbi:CCA tRNA nucleotidyltransferase [Achromobacter sp. F4_2707]|uniref:CCA tRNA nucleotidyltransferase n=1 Tax=Achromobacter sp. F4_2707 TaxID=3114286 RepID=UPI0039C609CC
MSRIDPAIDGLQAYVVGGAVRDALLQQPAGDRDWVVVGATPAEMEARGFIPVGGDFPVFLHPRTKEEFALARTERKSGRGYKGFTFYTGTDVTLEDDLQRRDLTINAIARHADGTLVDPCGGLADLQAGVLRHVGAAFSEDPVRLLRLARFAARFPTFTVAPETMEQAALLVESGEVDALVPERVWQEVAKGLMTERPGRMFEVLSQSGALARVMPELVYGDEIGIELAKAHRQGLSLASRYAILCRLTPESDALSRRVRAPSECASHAVLLREMLAGLDAQDADTALSLMERCDVLRKPQRFKELLQACACVREVDQSAWHARLQAVCSVDAGAIARTCEDRSNIPAAVRGARLQALQALFS